MTFGRLSARGVASTLVPQQFRRQTRADVPDGDEPLEGDEASENVAFRMIFLGFT